MILTLDIGNSRVKAGLFREGMLEEMRVLSHEELLSILEKGELRVQFGMDLQYVGWVSVGKSGMKTALRNSLQEQEGISVLEITKDTTLPIELDYESPGTLGMDRVCAAVGAWERAGGPVLCIDAGTALTYEYVDAEGCYQGGGITPGLFSRFRALDEFTAALPLVRKEGYLPLVGKDTESCIRSGVVNGLVAECEGIIDRYIVLAGPKLKVCLTGGDAEFLGNLMKKVNFVDSNLLLSGIYAIILHHSHHA